MNDKQKKSGTFAIIFVVFIILLIIVLYGVPLKYYLSLFKGLPIDKNELGTLGDYIGGILNPFVSLLAFSGLLYTIYLQRKDIEIARKELRASTNAQTDSSRALKEQLQAIEKQNFESTFFHLLSLFNSSAEAVRVGAWQGIVARESLYLMVRELQEEYKKRLNSGEKDSENEALELSFKEVVIKTKGTLTSYLNNLAVITNFLAKHGENFSSVYVDTLKGQLSPHEIQVLFYYFCYFPDIKGLKCRLEQYKFFDQLKVDDLLTTHKYLSVYDRIAYGDLDVDSYFH